MTKIHFKDYNYNQTVLFPQRIDEDIANNDPVRIIDALVESLDMDGTKIESKANRYTFVWRKTVERNRERLIKKIKVLLIQIDDVIVQDKTSNMETVSFTPSMLTELADELRSTFEQTSPLPST